MSSDAFFSFHDEDRRLAAGVALTTQTCRDARRLHGFALTSCIAMGRMLTSTALAAFIQRRVPTSIQVLADRHLLQPFADINIEGHLRVYLSNPTLAVTRPGGEGLEGRRSIASAVGRGTLSVIRLGRGAEFTQSTTTLISGELDADVEHFLCSSDQIPTALLADVLLNDASELTHAGGIVIQAMPGADPETIAPFRGELRDRFAALLAEHPTDAGAIVNAILPNAHAVDSPIPLCWQCRCSYERAIVGLKMLPPEDLAQMVDAKEDAEVSCDFCRSNYVIPADQVEQAFLETITARG